MRRFHIRRFDLEHLDRKIRGLQSPLNRGCLLCFLACSTLLAVTLARAQETGVDARVEISKNGRKLKDASGAVVWLTRIGGAEAAPPAQKDSEIPSLVQKNKAFHPSLLVVPVGGKVEFPNHDPFFHNVFSMFEGKRFDLGLYESGTTRFVQFDKPGISYIFCNIHAQMSAVVIALNTPYYAISDAHGTVTIAGVPRGRYQMQIFHASVPPDQLRTLSREITVITGVTSVGLLSLSEPDIELAHKNKYGQEYDRPEPESPAYARP
jgi:plastocyanin